MAYIYPAPGVTNSEVTLNIAVAAASASDTSGLDIAGLQDVTINNANDVFTWTQLDETAKKQIATTSTNSVSMNLVVDQTIFFGDGTTPAVVAADYGIFGLSKDKVKINFELFLGKTDSGASGKTISGSGYITGLAPTVSADSPVWVTPVTITVDGEYTVS